MITTVRARMVGIRVTDETILGCVDRRSGGPGLMICLNAFQTTENVFNDVVVVIASPQHIGTHAKSHSQRSRRGPCTDPQGASDHRKQKKKHLRPTDGFGQIIEIAAEQ